MIGKIRNRIFGLSQEGFGILPRDGLLAQRQLIQQLTDLGQRMLHMAGKNGLHDGVQRLGAGVFLAQFRQHGGDILREDRAGGKDQHAVGIEGFAAAVHQIGRAVHGDAGFAGAGAADDGEHRRILEADGAVLLLLNGIDDAMHLAGYVFRQDIQQQRIVDGEGGVHVILQAAVFHAVLALEGHLAGDLAVWAGIAAFAGQRVVVQAGDGRAPVVHQQRTVMILQGIQADDDLIRILRAVLAEIHTGKEGLEQHLPAAARLVVREGLAGEVAVDFQAERLHLLHGNVGGLQAQFVPCVGQQGIDRVHMALGKTLGFVNDRPQHLLHIGGVFLLLLKLGKVGHCGTSGIDESYSSL